MASNPPESQPQPPPTQTEIPTFTFTHHPSLAPYNIAPSAFLATHPQYDLLATGSLVFTTSPSAPSAAFATQPGTGPDTGTSTSPSHQHKILLLQRAPHDSLPHLWEIPGGAIESLDATILRGAVRELWEETGLRAVEIGAEVGLGVGVRSLDPDGQKHVFFTRSGRRVGKVCFLVGVERDGDGGLVVRLDEHEHQAFCWASEEECRARRLEGVGEIRFTSREQEEIILEGFRLMKEGNVEGL